jgi:predicted ATPase
MHNDTERFFVVTGGPGSGKSSLLEGIHRHGYLTPSEAGRGVIQDQIAIGGHALPWGDRQLFSELMLSWDMRSYHIAEQSFGPVFFDRGVPDVIGYLRLCGLPIPEHIRNAATAFRYNRTVFIAPPWPEIFRQDRERKQDFEEAVRTYRSLVETYTEQQYELRELPRVSVEARIEFVLENVATRSRR